MICVKVPATTANMGSGFDCIGMALNLYNETCFELIDARLEIVVKGEQNILWSADFENNEAGIIPTDEENLIYRSFLRFYELNNIGEAPGIRIIQNDNIPMARGLGSSAACIAAGFLAANELGGKHLTRLELAEQAAFVEGHPDNVVPAILGGMAVAALDSGQRMKYVKIDVPDEILFITMIPEFPLYTEKARAILPSGIQLKDGIFNASRAALLAASFLTKNWDNLDCAMDDCFHQPYRQTIINGMAGIFAQSKKANAKGVYLSGAGPTIIAAVKKEDADRFIDETGAYLDTLTERWAIVPLKAENEGASLTIN